MKVMKDALSLSLSKDETVMSERFTNLEKPFNQIPEYTPVFNRREHTLASFPTVFLVIM